MKNGTKAWLITAALLIFIGCLLFAGIMTAVEWDFTELSTVNYVTNTYDISEEFDGIYMNTDTAHIEFMLSDDGECRVECYEEEDTGHSVTVKDNTLSVELTDRNFASGYIGINFGSPKITVYLPREEYGSLFIDEATGDIEIPDDFMFKNVDISLSTGDVDFSASVTDEVKIRTSTGNINVENISAGTLDLTVSTGRMNVFGATCDENVTVGVSTGKADLTDIKCKNIISKGTTGSISLCNVIAEEKFSVERSTGDVIFESCDAANIYVKTNTGDVRGTLLSDKVFITDTGTGKVNVPKTISGGKCEIYTSTGDIDISIQK